MANEKHLSKFRFFHVTGLDCAEEVAILKRQLGPMVGSEDLLTFDVLNSKLGIGSSGDVVTDAEILSAIQKTGMNATIWRNKDDAAEVISGWKQWERTILTTASGLATFIGWVIELLVNQKSEVVSVLGNGVDTHPVSLAAKIAFGIAMLTGSWTVLPKAWHAAKRLQPDMNLLMVIAIMGAIGIGEWLEGATVAFLFAVSLLLESWSVNRARRAVGKLLELAPVTARIIKANGEEATVSPEELNVGTRFIIHPGEKIPLDGRVLSGKSHVNQAPITGESLPVSKNPSDEVFAGTINGDGVLEVECTKPATNSTLAQIIRLVGEAQSRRAPAEKWVEKFSRIYTPIVMVLAVLVGVISPLIFQVAWNQALYQSLVFLVIACPCALVISTPVSVVAALTAATRQGILIKGGEFIEAPSKLRAIAFDKTGTLTEGKPAVKKIVALNGHTEIELLERASSLEQRSDHPLARAIVDYAESKKINVAPAEEFQLIQGKGATAKFDGRDFWIGSHRYLEERGQETPEVHQLLEDLASQGNSIVVVGNDQHVCGFIALADSIRPNAKKVLAELRRLGMEHLIMLTGDNHATAEAVAKDIGLTEFQAEMLPQDKVTAIEKLNRQYGNVAMVGDGVNDAPALARADIGLAMGAVGSDAAIETADIALMSDNIAALPWLIKHSRHTMRIIRQNITFSLSIKAIFVLLSFFGMASLWMAIAADTGASLLVIMNALRLLHYENN